tara:strand:- start:206 stop:1222 length:1017 start_codon:yes stop_codon:yes gene_type:complete
MGFKRLDAEDFVVSADAVQSTAWSTDTPDLTQFYTSSIQKGGSSGKYYMSVYQSDPEVSSDSTCQFDIAYGNINGSGSKNYNDLYPQLTPSSTTYGQYRTMILEDENSLFTYGSGTNEFTPDSFIAISVERSRYKEKLFAPTFNLSLSGPTANVALTNDSVSTTTSTFYGTTRVYQVVEGINGSPSGATGYVANSGSYGLFLPEIGTILLNPAALKEKIGLNFSTAQNPNNQSINFTKLYDAIVAGGYFQLNAEETITSDYIFIRARNSEFNYSTNPSFISGSTGELVYTEFINNPQVYATTVGMYNDNNECVAVAKLSKPLLKDFTKESLVRVKLDF